MGCVAVSDSSLMRKAALASTPHRLTYQEPWLTCLWDHRRPGGRLLCFMPPRGHWWPDHWTEVLRAVILKKGSGKLWLVLRGRIAWPMGLEHKHHGISHNRMEARDPSSSGHLWVVDSYGTTEEREGSPEIALRWNSSLPWQVGV